MEKLTFYSLSSPEKLDRIGEYIFQRASRDISRKKTWYVPRVFCQFKNFSKFV